MFVAGRGKQTTCDRAQDLFISMRAMLFVGGLAKDKTVFALVHEDPAKVRSCHLFQTDGPVRHPANQNIHSMSQAISVMQSIQKGFVTFKQLVAANPPKA